MHLKPWGAGQVESAVSAGGLPEGTVKISEETEVRSQKQAHASAQNMRNDFHRCV